MRRTTPSTDRGGQSGQALVLIALCLAVLIGMTGLAVDGGRLYWERRILQNSVDAAALAASDAYERNQSETSAITAAGKEYAANEKITTTGTATDLGSGKFKVTWSGSTDVMNITYTAAGSVSTFDVSSTHTVGLVFVVVLGAGSTAKVSALAEGRAKTGGTLGAALVTLSQGSCSGSNNPSLSDQGGGSGGGIIVNGGNIQSNGSVSLSGRNVYINTNGYFYDNCTCPVPSQVTAASGAACGVAPVATPPLWGGDATQYQSNQATGASPVLQPGIYNGTLGDGSHCFFMDGGIYVVNGGFTQNGGMLANELRPPDEPSWDSTNGVPNYDSSVASPQFWPSPCAGSFGVGTYTAVTALNPGKWGVMLRSGRNQTYPPSGYAGSTSYTRVSTLSTCHSLTVGSGQGIQVTINNVVGATFYDVFASYASSGDPCTAGKWGFVERVNANLTSPSAQTTSSMLTTTAQFDAGILTILPTSGSLTTNCTPGSTPTVGCVAPTGSYGSAVPPGDGAETAPVASGTYPWVAARDVYANGGGDQANYHNCVPRSTDASNPCSTANVTPGAVQIQLSSSSCWSTSGGALVHFFSGYQFNWLGIYATSANTCSDSAGGSGGLQIQGGVYTPGANWSIAGNGATPIASEFIANSLTATGNGQLTITYDVSAVPSQGYSQLSL
jgi:Flp pilus assembly protein TadG